MGLAVSALLLWLLWRQSGGRLASLQGVDWWRADTRGYGIAALLLLPLNIFLESRKWQWLLRDAAAAPFSRALASVLTGITFSLITPNRIGEYPGRLLALQRKFTPRLISVSILGASAQFIAVLFAGFAGGFWYCWHHNAYSWPAWAINAAALGLAFTFYFSYERWSRWIDRIGWLKKFNRYSALMRHLPQALQWKILGISILRYSVFTLQYYLALRWLGVAIPIADGLPLCAVFFWMMAVIPSISLAEAGVRAEVSWQLFHTYSDTGAVVAATMALWLVNLLIPALAGALLILRLRIFPNKKPMINDATR